MATAEATALTTSWTKVGDTGFEYLCSRNGGDRVNYAFSTTTPSTAVLGHPMTETTLVLTPPGSDNVYMRAAGNALVTVTPGNAIA